ncbi:MAG: sulfatase [Myxococcota bacterium]
MLLATPSCFVLIASVVAVAVVKAGALMDIDGVAVGPLLWLVAIATDVALHLGLAALFALGEWRRPWLKMVTIPLAVLVAGLAAANAGYLATTGEQLSWEAVQYGVDSWNALMGIVGEKLDSMPAATLVLASLGLFALPALARVLLRRQSRPDAPADKGHAARCAALIAVPALVLAIAAPSPDSLAATRLTRNAVLDTYWSWLRADQPVTVVGAPDQAGQFTAYRPETLVAAEDIAALAGKKRRNLLVLVLESTRYDATSLGDPDSERTPRLAALARRGTSVPVTRAVVPHTSKSLFSMFCGRIPLMHRAPVEVSETVKVQCLPRILAAAGYHTGFFQSALGTFEQRPRLVARLGYQHFNAWEDIGGQPLGYLASDDESLTAAVARWLDSLPLASGQPFFATVLTSAAHHPYRLPGVPPEQAPADDKERYLRLIAAQDRLLGALIDDLEQRGVLDDTIIAVAGDHGEGFGDKGIRQHDNNFYEEGLRVPMVLAGPGVPVGTVTGNASLIDLTPTLLAVIGLPVPKLSGAYNLMAGPVPAVPRWFGCYYYSRCRGFVFEQYKVVYVPQNGQIVYFDMADDPDERRAKLVAGASVLPSVDFAEYLTEMHRVIEAHRPPGDMPIRLGGIPDYGDWRCPIGRPCRHPDSPKGAFFEQP